MTCEIRFTGPNKHWYETRERHAAIEADEENEILAKPAVMDVCQFPKTMEVGYIHLEEVECDHEGDVLGFWHKQAVFVLGPEWEIFGLKAQ